MALREKLEILVDANVQGYVSGMDKAAGATKRLDAESSKLDRMAGKFTTMGAAAVGGAAVAAVGLGKLAQIAGEAQVAQAKLDNSIKNSSQTFSDGGAAISDMASQLQKKVAADDESIRSGSAVLIQFGLTEDQVKKLTPLVVDLSRKMGVDMDAAAKAVGKSATGTTTALKRMGIDVGGLSDSSDSATATIEALSKSVGGFAQAEGRTFSGQLAILKNQMQEIGESVGMGVAGTLGTVVGKFNDLASAATDVNPGIAAAVGSLGTIATVGVGGLGALSFAAGQFLQMKDNLGQLTSKLRDAEGGLTRLGSAAKGIGTVAVGVGAAVAIAEVANEFNKASQNAAKFDDAMAVIGGAKQGDRVRATAVALNSLTGTLDGVSVGFDKFNKKAGLAGQAALTVGTLGLYLPYKLLNDQLGNNADSFGIVSVGARRLTVDLNQLGEATDKVVDSGNLATLKAWREQLDQIRTPKGSQGRSDLQDEKRRVDDLIASQTKAAAAQRSVNVEAERAATSARQAGLATGEYAATADDLKEVLDGLKVASAGVTAAWDLNQARAKGFSSAYDAVTNGANQAIDAAQAVGSAVNSVFKPTTNPDGTKVAAAIRSLPPEFNSVTAAIGGYSDEQNKAIDGLQQFGAAAQAHLKTMLSVGMANDQVVAQGQRYADFLRFTLTSAFRDQGLSIDDAKAKVEQYINEIGLSKPQLETQITVSGQEKAMQILQLLASDFDNLAAKDRALVFNAIRTGDFDQALNIYNGVKDKQVTATVNADTAPAQNAWTGWLAGFGAQSHQQVGVSADTSQADQGIASLQGRARQPQTMKVDADTSMAASKVVGLGNLVSAAGKRFNDFFVPGARASGGTRGGSGGGGGGGGSWAAGGLIPGRSSRDDTLAMVMGGEYVVSQRAVDKYGVGFLDKLNTGQLPHFASGGMVAAAKVRSGVPVMPTVPVPASSKDGGGGVEFLRSELARIAASIENLDRPGLTYVVQEATHRDDPVDAYQMMSRL